MDQQQPVKKKRNRKKPAKPKKTVSVYLPIDDHIILARIAASKGLEDNISAVVREAVDEYIKRNLNSLIEREGHKETKPPGAS